MEKRTIAEIAVDILKAAKGPLAISEITQAILDKGLTTSIHQAIFQ